MKEEREGTSFENVCIKKYVDWVAERIPRPEMTLGLVTLKAKSWVMERHIQGLTHESSCSVLMLELWIKL